MFRVNSELVERAEDQSYFDSSRFAIIKLNPSGYDLFEEIKNFSFSKESFLERCESRGMPPDVAISLWLKSIEHFLIVEIERSVVGAEVRRPSGM